MSILIIAEHDGHELKSVTKSVIAAATQIGGSVDLLVAGHNCEAVVDAAKAESGVSRVMVANNECYAHQLAENVSLLIAGLAADYSHVLAAATTQGKNTMPRVAALLDVDQVSEIIEIVSPDTFKRLIYAGNVIATVQSEDVVKVITVRGTAFDGLETIEGADAEVILLDQQHNEGVSEFVSEQLAESDRPELTAAKVVISGGRGMQNGDNFSMLYSIADKLNAGVGASRAAVDAGFVPNDMQVGQTGKIVAPELYIAVGISGAIQHLAGMKDSKVIVAINKDEDAPIFQVADYGLVADLFTALPELEAML